MKFFTFAVMLTLIGLAGCTSSMRTETMVHPEYQVTTMKTYAWSAEHPLTLIGVLVGNPVGPMETVVKKFFSEAMAEKGYTNVEVTEKPDFLVSFTAGAATQMTRSNHNVDRTHVYVSWSQYNDHLEGGLSITFSEPATNTNMWQGKASDRVKERDSRKEDGSTIKRLIDEILKSLPARNSY